MSKCVDIVGLQTKLAKNNEGNIKKNKPNLISRCWQMLPLAGCMIIRRLQGGFVLFAGLRLQK